MTSPALIAPTSEIAAGTRGSRSLNRLVRPQRITMAILRWLKFCWPGMFWSTVIRTSKARGFVRFQQASVLKTRQIGETRGLAFVPRKQKTQPLIDAFIDQKLHEARASKSFRASPRASKARPRETVGNPMTKSSRVSPRARYSNSVCTGTRVPRNTGTPCVASHSAENAHPRMSGRDCGRIAGNPQTDLRSSETRTVRTAGLSAEAVVSVALAIVLKTVPPPFARPTAPGPNRVFHTLSLRNCNNRRRTITVVNRTHRKFLR